MLLQAVAVVAAPLPARCELDGGRNVVVLDVASGSARTLTTDGRYADPKCSLDGRVVGAVCLDEVHYQEELVIFVDGEISARISGEPLVHRWVLQDGGRLVAAQLGPSHGGASTVLYDSSGAWLSQLNDAEVASPVSRRPSWLDALEDARLFIRPDPGR